MYNTLINDLYSNFFNNNNNNVSKILVIISKIF